MLAKKGEIQGHFPYFRPTAPLLIAVNPGLGILGEQKNAGREAGYRHGHAAFLQSSQPLRRQAYFSTQGRIDQIKGLLFAAGQFYLERKIVGSVV